METWRYSNYSCNVTIISWILTRYAIEVERIVDTLGSSGERFRLGKCLNLNSIFIETLAQIKEQRSNLESSGAFEVVIRERKQEVTENERSLKQYA